MKKLIAILAILALTVSSLYAFDFKKENITVGVEYNALESDIADKHLVTLTIPGLEAEIYGAISDFKTKEMLVSIGYELSDYLKPYVLLGAVNVDYDYRLVGKLGAGSLNILSSSVDTTGFAYGFGITGDVLKFDNGLLLSYDLRRVASRPDESLSTDIAGIFSSPTDVNVHYAKWETTVLLSKEFTSKNIPLINKITETVTPFVGYKYSNIDVDMTQDIQLAPKVKANVDFSANGSNNSILIGNKIKINNNFDVIICSSLLDEKGIMAKVTYRF
jgi:hypothetical protein